MAYQSLRKCVTIASSLHADSESSLSDITYKGRGIYLFAYANAATTATDRIPVRRNSILAVVSSRKTGYSKAAARHRRSYSHEENMRDLSRAKKINGHVPVGITIPTDWHHRFAHFMSWNTRNPTRLPRMS